LNGQLEREFHALLEYVTQTLPAKNSKRKIFEKPKWCKKAFGRSFSWKKFAQYLPQAVFVRTQIFFRKMWSIPPLHDSKRVLEKCNERELHTKL
jgi:hypothetical protein